MATPPRAPNALRHLASYGLVTALTAGAAFLAVPVLIRLLGLEGFGVWSLLEPLIMAGSVLVLLGIEHGAIKQIAHDRQAPGLVSGRLLASAAPAAVLIAAAFFLGIAPAWGLRLAALTALLVLAEGLLTLVTTSCRAADLPGGYALGQGGRAVLFLAVLAAGLTWPVLAVVSVETAVAARLGIVAVLGLSLAVILRARPRWAPAPYGDAVRYGGFILLTGLLATVVEAGDRYVLAWFYDPALVGAYVVHIKLASIVGQGITTPFMLWFPVERFRHLQDVDGGSAFFRTAAILMLGTLLAVSGGVWLAGPLLTSLMAPGVVFDPVASAFILAAIVLVGMSYPINVGLLKPGLTHRNVYPSLLAAPLSIGLAVLLVPATGMEGAAAAKALGAAATLILLTMLSQRAHPVDFAYGRMAVLVASAILLVLSVHHGLSGTGMLASALKITVFFAGMASVTLVILDAPARAALLSSIAWGTSSGGRSSGRRSPAVSP